MIIIGAGVAGLMAALAAAPAPVTLIDPCGLKKGGASWLSQGGMAAAIGADDSVDFHIADTLAAGAGLCDQASVSKIIRAGPQLVDILLSLGVKFDRDEAGALALGLEAAHCRHRILHGGGDRTGAVIMQALVARAEQTPSISIVRAWAERLLIGDAGVEAVQCANKGAVFNLIDRHVLLATGGIGGLFRHSTNPSGAVGHGLILALEAGAALKNSEFIQFHPTALAVSGAPLPLVSEAVRGEGARLIDETGCYFMDGRDLAPRDVVARAVFAHLAQGHRTFLDASNLAATFSARFPTINDACLLAGIDPKTQPIPVQPAAHYHMGGVSVDADGRTSIDGLYAAGEVACTGLHGANRLASNSLLEAAICGWEIGRLIGPQSCLTMREASCHALPLPLLVEPIKDLMTTHCGVLRSAQGLTQAIEKFEILQADNRVAQLALLIAKAALDRTNSVGAHARIESLSEGFT